MWIPGLEETAFSDHMRLLHPLSLSSRTGAPDCARCKLFNTPGTEKVVSEGLHSYGDYLGSVVGKTNLQRSTPNMGIHFKSVKTKSAGPDRQVWESR